MRPGTSRPIYGDRDRKIHYALSEISEERREGYSWEGTFGVPDVIAYYERIRRVGRDAWLERHDRSEVATGPLSPAPGVALSGEQLEHEVTAIIDAEDGAGRWVTNGTIESDTYVRNIHLLSAYLER